MDEVGQSIGEDLRVQLEDMGPAPIPVPRETLERWRDLIRRSDGPLIYAAAGTVLFEMDQLLK